MKPFIVSSNSELTAMLLASDGELAKKLAKQHFEESEGIEVDIKELEAYPIDEYLNPWETVTISIEYGKRMTEPQKIALSTMETVGCVEQVVMQEDGTLKVNWWDGGYGQCKYYYIDKNGGVK